MAKINMEKVTLLNKDFIQFNQIINNDVVIIDGDVESGLHLIGHGTGDQMWCDYDYNEYHLKFGRITLMNIGEQWRESHNNWYGYDETITLIDKQEYNDGRTFLTIDWERYTNKKVEQYSETIQIIVSLNNNQIEEYHKIQSFLHNFVYIMSDIEWEHSMKLYNTSQYWEDEIIDLDEITEEIIE